MVAGFFYVRSVVGENTANVEKKENTSAGVEVKPAKIVLKVYYNGSVKEYKAYMQNVDTVLDLLEELRSNQGFWYEKIAYTYGTELDEINHVEAPQGYKWKIFLDGTDITYSIGEKNLTEDEVFELKLVPNTPNTDSSTVPRPE